MVICQRPTRALHLPSRPRTRHQQEDSSALVPGFDSLWTASIILLHVYQDGGIGRESSTELFSLQSSSFMPAYLLFYQILSNGRGAKTRESVTRYHVTVARRCASNAASPFWLLDHVGCCSLVPFQVSRFLLHSSDDLVCLYSLGFGIMLLRSCSADSDYRD